MCCHNNRFLLILNVNIQVVLIHLLFVVTGLIQSEFGLHYLYVLSGLRMGLMLIGEVLLLLLLLLFLHLQLLNGLHLVFGGAWNCFRGFEVVLVVVLFGDELLLFLEGVGIAVSGL